MRKILVGLFDQRMDPIVIYYDNQTCIKISENPVFHDKSKHIDIYWYTMVDNYFTRLGFTKNEADVNLYSIVMKGELLIIILYVYVLIVTSDD